MVALLGAALVALRRDN
ncbi:hypothetical protein [Natrinema altunense]